MLDRASTPARGGPVVLHGVSWAQYEALLAAFGDDHPSLRLTYLEGMLEIMTTSPAHEEIKTIVARLLETWATERDIPLAGYGAATFRAEAAERGLEPDECYVIGGMLVDVPDLAIEVVHAHLDIDKLSVYAGLGVKEVWIWDDGRFAIHVLRAGAMVPSEHSSVLPSLDLPELTRFVRPGTPHTELARAYLASLRAPKTP